MSDGTPLRYCPSCGAEYVATATACADCRVALVDERPWESGEEVDVDDLGFDLSDWAPELRSRLEARLAEEGIPFGWEDGELVVDPADGDRAEALIDELDWPDALDAEDDDGNDGDDAAEVMSVLFVAADRLCGDPGASAAVVEAIEGAEAAAALDPPYGFDPAAWAAVVERADGLAEALAGDADDDAVVAAARALRDLLRPSV